VRGDLKEKVLRYKKSLKKCSRLLRENMTEAERLLWEKIKISPIPSFPKRGIKCYPCACCTEYLQKSLKDPKIKSYQMKI